MATTKRGRKTHTPLALLEALKFVSVAQHSEGTLIQQHCRISEGTIVAFDGGITAGQYIDESLNVCPHTATLIKALSKCTENVSITELDSGKLSVKSGKFRATVPCAPFADLPAVQPDNPCATLTDSLKSALAACMPLALDGGEQPFTCAVLLQAGTCVSTNRHVIIEAFHGIDLPPGILIPKASVAAIVKSHKSLKSFGFSNNSATFFFEDDSFIKTQLFVDKFPDYNKILNIEENAIALPLGFYDALEKVFPFIDKDLPAVYFIDGKMCSESNSLNGANYEVEGLINGLAFNANYLKLIKEHAHRVHFNANERGMALFFGDNVRGAIMKVNFNGS